MLQAHPSPASAARLWGTRNLLACVTAAGLALFTACGGGGNKTPPPPPFTLSAASLSLPVPPTANQSGYPTPYVGTVTLTLNRTSSFTDPVTMAVATSSLPTGVKANFPNATIPSGSNTVVLSIQAGYPDPTDTTFYKQIYPAPGTYAIPFTATSGTTTQSATLTLNLVAETASFALSFVTSDGTTAVDNTNLNLIAGTPVTEYFMAYWAAGTFNSPYGPVSLGIKNLPAGLNASFDTSSFTLNDVHPLTITPATTLAAGIYSFDITASYLGETLTMPVIVSCGPAPFALRTPLSTTISVAQGSTLTFPFYLWHEDDYFGTNANYTTTDPLYVGTTALSVSGASATTPQASFTTTAINGLASVPLQVSALAGTTIGTTYALQLQATRNGATTTAAPPMTLNVRVTDPAASPTTWIQTVEWGQTVVAPNLKLIANKPALLQVQLLADRGGVPAPAVTATITSGSGATLDTLTLQGPATIPTTITEGDLPTATTPSGSTYTAILPAKDVQAGMTVAIQAGTATQSLAPAVDPGTTLNLTIVPIYVQSVAPVLPSDAVMSAQMTAFWPIQGVKLVHRAPYTTSTIIPAPSTNPLTDTSSNGWFELLLEEASLRLVDGATSYYYGMFNPGLPAKFTSTIAGLSLLGEGIGIGVDTVTASVLQNDTPAFDLATSVMVHEEGHAFNLNHAPAGGAGAPQLDYPYQGAVIGTWGFDPVTQTAYAPTQNYDIMSYAPHPVWVSDWDYLNAMGWIGGLENPSITLTPDLLGAADQYVVTGWIGPDGTPHLSPLIRVSCAPRTAKPGPNSLVLTTAAGTRTVAFTATQVADLPAGHLHFAFTVPAGDELLSAEVRTPGAPKAFRVRQARSLAARAQAVGAAAQNGSQVIRETPGNLHLEWDAQAHPFVNVIHEGATRTTLGLHLRGGSADLPLTGLAAGGHFTIHYSDGLNTVAHHAPRVMTATLE